MRRLSRERLARIEALVAKPGQDHAGLRRELTALETEYQELFREVMRTDTTHREHAAATERFLLANGSEGSIGRIDQIKHLLLSPDERQEQAERSAEWEAELQQMTAEEINGWVCERIRATHEH